MDEIANRPSLNILQVCPYPMAALGGVQNQVSWLSEALQEAGHSVDILAPPRTSLALPGQFNGATVYHADTLVGIAKLIKNSSLLANYDVLHIHEPLQPFAWTAARLAKRIAVPMVATVHTSNDAYYMKYMGKAWKAIHNVIGSTIATSTVSRNTACSYISTEIDIIPLGIPICPKDQEHSGRLHKPVASNVLFIGRHDKRKGLLNLLAATEPLTDLEAIVIGEGPETKQLRRTYANSHISWRGRVDEEAKTDLLHSCDIFCSPVISGEGFGIVLLEAMRCGVPIVASDLPAYREVLGSDEDGNAIFVPPNQVKALSKAIQYIKSDKVLREQLSLNSLQRISRFTIKSAATAYSEHYTNAINR